MFILFILIIGIGIYFLNQGKQSECFNFSNRKDAKDILDKRFVNGEIDEESYKKMKEALNG